MSGIQESIEAVAGDLRQTRKELANVEAALRAVWAHGDANLRDDLDRAMGKAMNTPPDPPDPAAKEPEPEIEVVPKGDEFVVYCASHFYSALVGAWLSYVAGDRNTYPVKADALALARDLNARGCRP